MLFSVCLARFAAGDAVNVELWLDWAEGGDNVEENAGYIFEASALDNDDPVERWSDTAWGDDEVGAKLL